MKLLYTLILFAFFISCSTEPEDCAGVAFGSKILDDYGDCCYDFSIDCSGRCEGGKQEGSNGGCCEWSQMDCNYECGGSAVYDNCSVCGGSNSCIRNVSYSVSGTAEMVDVTLSNPSGGTEQYTDRILPYTYTFSSYEGDFLYISAQNQGSSGTVTTKIIVDGSTFKESTSSGAYVIASASGSCP
jgi:hypothetical protein